MIQDVLLVRIGICNFKETFEVGTGARVDTTSHHLTNIQSFIVGAMHVACHPIQSLFFFFRQINDKRTVIFSARGFSSKPKSVDIRPQINVMLLGER